MDKATKLREMFKDNKVVRIVGAHNGLTAKLVEKADFDAVWASGLEVSTSHAVPDANILTMTDFLNATISMNDAINIPVVADCDTGYGNSNNVIRMVRKFEDAGIAAVCIEDKLFPKVNSFIPGRQELAPIPEFMGKIMAAKNAQRTEDFMVFARVEALIAGWGLEEALKRAEAYIDAGADGIFIHSKKDNPDEILDFIKAWNRNAPLIICPTTYSQLTLDEIKKLGKVKMVIYANHGIRASIKAISDVLKEINRLGTTKSIENRIATMKDVFELQGMPEMKESEKLYLRSGNGNIKVIIPAAGEVTGGSYLIDLLKNTPVAMLDIHGKSILQRNMETLNSIKIYDIDVVAGYAAEKINVEGVNIIRNPDYKKTFIMDSIMKAAEKTEDKTLVIFSDILFERGVIEKLLKSEDDITIVIDRSYKDRPPMKGKKLDLVIAKHDPIKGERVINLKRENPTLKIGKDIDPEKANYEFVGVALFSKKGLKALKETYEKSKKKYRGKKFHEAESFEKAGMTDILQEMMDQGYKVSSVEIDKGWTEIRSFEDYKRTSSLIAECEKVGDMKTYKIKLGG